MDYLPYYMIVINLVGLYLMFIDKNRAIKRKYRISEKTLWFIAFIGGAIGETIGMYSFRHKTKHASFKWGLPLLSIIFMVLIFLGF